MTYTSNSIFTASASTSTPDPSWWNTGIQAVGNSSFICIWGNVLVQANNNGALNIPSNTTIVTITDITLPKNKTLNYSQLFFGRSGYGSPSPRSNVCVADTSTNSLKLQWGVSLDWGKYQKPGAVYVFAGCIYFT